VLGQVESDAMWTSLLNNAVIGAEMMKISPMKAIMNMVDLLMIHTTGYDTFSGRAAMQAQRIGNGWYRNQYGLYCKSGQKAWTILYYGKENGLHYGTIQNDIRGHWTI
jgi:hypothetical protein